MHNRDLRITALNRYLSLLRKEETRLFRVKSAPTSTELEVATSGHELRATVEKIANANKELKSLQQAVIKPNKAGKGTSHTHACKVGSASRSSHGQAHVRG